MFLFIFIPYILMLHYRITIYQTFVIYNLIAYLYFVRIRTLSIKTKSYHNKRDKACDCFKQNKEGFFHMNTFSIEMVPLSEIPLF